MPDHSDPVELQRHRNIQSRAEWTRFEPHRQRVTTQIIDHSPPAANIAILGAGNLNDCDLSALRSRCARIEMFDLDGPAMHWGVCHQLMEADVSVVLHGETDLLGLANFNLDDKEVNVDRVLEVVRGHRVALSDDSFDVVVSTCLLSQLIEWSVQLIGQRHERMLEVVQAVRDQHFKMMYDVVRPGGTCLLILDFVSSATFPQLATVSHSDLPSVIRQRLTAGDFFTGLNPGIIAAQLTNSPAWKGQLSSVVVSDPWLWDLGPRLYACCSIAFTRTSQAVIWTPTTCGS